MVANVDRLNLDDVQTGPDRPDEPPFGHLIIVCNQYRVTGLNPDTSIQAEEDAIMTKLFEPETTSKLRRGASAGGSAKTAGAEERNTIRGTIRDCFKSTSVVILPDFRIQTSYTLPQYREGIKVLWQKIAEASRRPLLLGGDARCPLNAALAIGYVKDAVAAIRAAGDSGDLSVLGPYFTALLYTAESVVKAAQAEAAATRSAVCDSMESAADIEDFYHGGLIDDMMASIRSSLAAGGVPASFLTTEPGKRLMAQVRREVEKE